MCVAAPDPIAYDVETFRTASETDRRRDCRYPCSVRALLVFDGEQLEVMTDDVSYQGVFLGTDMRIPVGRLVQIDVPDLQFEGQPLRVTARVVYQRERNPLPGSPPAGVGAEMFALDGPARARWEMFVRSIARDAPHRLDAAVRALTAGLVVPDQGRQSFIRRLAVLKLRLRSSHEALGLYERDLPTGGMFLDTDAELPPGAPCIVDIQHPTHCALFRVHCRVLENSRDPQRPGVRVEFLDMDPARRSNFLTFVSDLLAA